MSRRTILNEIRAERKYQDENWGTEFDDRNTLNDWSTYVNIYMAQASAMTATPKEQRENMLKAATLLVAAIETFDRNGQFAPRHYEDRVPSGTRPGDESDNHRLKLVGVLDEIQTVRMTLETLLNHTVTTDQLTQQMEDIAALLCLIDRLVRTAHQLKKDLARNLATRQPNES